MFACTKHSDARNLVSHTPSVGELEAVCGVLAETLVNMYANLMYMQYIHILLYSAKKSYVGLPLNAARHELISLYANCRSKKMHTQRGMHVSHTDPTAKIQMWVDV